MSYTAKRGVVTKGGVFFRPGTNFDDLSDFDQPERLVAAGYFVEAGAAPATPEPEGRGDQVSPSLWTFDPAALKGKKLDELNVMVHEIDESVEPFTTLKEARAWLSQDYEG